MNGLAYARVLHRDCTTSCVTKACCHALALRELMMPACKWNLHLLALIKAALISHFT
jgi:hypothetical protein